MGFPVAETTLFGGLGTNFPEQSLSDKILAHFPFDEASSTTRYARFGRVFLLQNNGVTRASGVSPLTGFAADFNGTNQYLTDTFGFQEFAPASGGPGVAGNGGKIMESKVPNEWTMAGWVYLKSASPKAPAGIEEIVSKYGNADQGRGWVLQYVHADNARPEGMTFTFSTDGSNQPRIDYGNGSGLALDAWHHVRVSVSEAQDRVLMQVDNGPIQDYSLNGSGVYSNEDPLEFGRLNIPDAAFTDYGGISLDSWSFWGRVISLSENSVVYNNGSGLGFPWGPAHTLMEGVQGHWSLNEFAGQAIDNSGNSRAFETVGGAPTASAGVVGSGRAFDSSLSQYLEIPNASAQFASIGARDWTMGLRFKLGESPANNGMMIAKNGEGGVNGSSSEWNIQVLNRVGNTPPRLNWRVLYNTSPFESSVQASGETFGALDDGDFHTVMVGHINGSGTWMQVDGGPWYATDGLGVQNDGNADFSIGRRDFIAAPLYFDGVVGDVTIWHRFLSAQEREFYMTGEL